MRPEERVRWEARAEVMFLAAERCPATGRCGLRCWEAEDCAWMWERYLAADRAVRVSQQ